MKKIGIIILIAMAMVSFGFYTVNNLNDLVVEKLETYIKTDFPEKAYVQTDKSVYSLDETIWFTGYLVNGINHMKSSKSYVMYVELVNDKDSIVDQKKIFIEKISQAGDIKISKRWKPGKYLLRAYTNEMRNNSSEYFFKKDIWIWSLKNNSEDDEKKNTASLENVELFRPNLHFYPEGGHLIEGVNNKIAIKIKDKGFEDVDLSGIVYDNEGNEVSDFKVFKFGLGLILLQPEKGKTYYASININGNEEHYPLPKTEPKGFLINAVNYGDHIFVNVSSTIETGLKGTFLVAHQRGVLLSKKYENDLKTNYSINFPTKDLNDGIVHLTLFNSSGYPVSERLLFVQNPEKKVDLTIDKSKTELSSREKLTLKLNVNDFQGNPASGNFSMAVKNLKSSPQNSYQENIKTWLLLNSDLRGAIESPGYFFENGSDVKRRYLLDLVMLTNGWRRFTWDDILYKPRKKKAFEIEKGIFISGKAKNLKSRHENHSSEIRFTFIEKPPHQEVQQSDENGNFKFGPFVFFDSIPTLIEARSTSFNSTKLRDRKVLIMLDDNKVDQKIPHDENTSTRFDNQEYVNALNGVSKYLEQIKREFGDDVNELDEVVVYAKTKDELDQREQEMNERTNYGTPSDRVITEDVSAADYKTVLELLRGKAGLRINGTSVSIRGGSSVAFYLDGMEIDSTYIETLTASDISFIDILKGPEANVFSNSGSGVIAMYSKNGSGIGTRHIKRRPGIIDFSAKGFYVAKEFYAPDHVYGIEEQIGSDARTTLHWDPDIRLTKDDITEISFFTSDLKGDYVIEIEGVTDAGIPVHTISDFLVK